MATELEAATAPRDSQDAIESNGTAASVPTFESWTRDDLLAASAFFVSGVLALILEICWIRSATLLFGATTYAVSTVVAVFFAGLALGSWIFGRAARGTLRPLRMYATLEILIGVWALGSPTMMTALNSVFDSVYDSMLGSPWALLGVRFLIVTIVILPPTLMMGGSLPLFVRHYVRNNLAIAKPIGALYAINTFGAALGCLVCGVLLLPFLGVTSSIYLAAIVNIGLGLIVFTLPLQAPEISEELEDEETGEESNEFADSDQDTDRSEATADAGWASKSAERTSEKDGDTAVGESDSDDSAVESGSDDESDSDPDAEAGQDDDEYDDDEYEDDWSMEINESKVVTWMFFLTGFAALGYEILWTRFLGLVTQNTIYTYTFSLTVILLGMGLGTILTSRRLDQSDRRPLQFALCQAGIGLSILIIMLLPVSIWSRVSDPRTILGQFLVVALLLGLPSLLIGMAFPIALRLVIDRMGTAAREVGRMVAMNTLGGIAGALLVGFLLLPNIQMQHTLKFLTVINLLIAIATLMLLENRMSQVYRGLFCLTLALIWISVPYLAQQLGGTKLPESYIVGRRLMANEHIVEGVTANLAVLNDGPGKMHLEIDRMWQGANQRNHQVVAAHVPTILHPQPQDVLVVGLGAGQTTQAFLAHPEVRRLDCAEIEPQLITIIRTGRYFGDSRWMDGSDTQEVNVFAEDGRNYITHTKKTYDIISLEVGQVFRPSIGSFYTYEFYQHARERLNENGLICQFVPTDFLRVEDFRRVVATFREVFPTSLIWYNTSELLMIGTTGERFQLSKQRLRKLAANQRVHQDLEQAYWGGPAEYLHLEEAFLGGFITGPNGLANMSADVVLLRDAIPTLEYLKQPDESQFSEPIYDLLSNNKENVRQILTYQPTPLVAAKSGEIQEMNLRHLVARKYLQRGNSLLAQAKALINAGNMQAAGNTLSEAREYLFLARARLVRYAEVYESLGEAYAGFARVNFAVNEVLASQDNTVVAIDQLEEGLKIDPKSASMHNTLAFLKQNQGKADEAIQHFREVISLDPTSIQSINGLAKLLATRPDRKPEEAAEAVKLAEQAVKLQAGPMTLDTLGMALAAAGRFEEAAQAVEAAIELSSRMGVPSEAIEPFRHRSALYKSKRPYIENPGMIAPPPGATGPGAALPGSNLPGAPLPGSSLPGSSLPGSSLPGSSLPESSKSRPGTSPKGASSPNPPGATKEPPSQPTKK